jgi:glutamate dehydrogenase
MKHAEKRGYPHYRSFTTGKSPANGGIPHDLHGMTSIGVQEMVVGCLEALNLKEASVSKVQTGGPDGDLGSNQLKLSHVRSTTAVVDGSGVLYDPAGLDNDELLRIAHRRQPSSAFCLQKLSKDGFFVACGDRDRTLPDGTVVENGLMLRNSFHLTKYFKADLVMRQCILVGVFFI